jgi:pimeloyl-ACP methyl ester carboxylesterase
MPASSRERILANRSHFQRFEFDRVEWYVPSADEPAAADRPVAVLTGTKSPPFFREAADWLANQLGVAVTVIPGGHTPQEDHPQDVAKAVREFMLPT